MILLELKNMALTAMKNKEANARSLLSTLVGEVENKLKTDMKYINSSVEEKAKREEAVVLAKIKSMRDDTTFLIGNIEDETSSVAVKAKEELRMLEDLFTKFAPKQLTEEELVAAISKYKQEGASKLGDVMKRLQSDFSGKFDGATASSLIKKML